jgi:hypothetical protein
MIGSTGLASRMRCLNLSDEGREFLMTGITQVEWDSLFSETEEV